jgi:hypothetical protein
MNDDYPHCAECTNPEACFWSVLDGDRPCLLLTPENETTATEGDTDEA